MQALPGGEVEANVSRPPSLSTGVAAEPQLHPRHSQRWEHRTGASDGDGGSQDGSSRHRDPAHMVVPLIYGSDRLNFPRPADGHGGSHVRCCAHRRHHAHRHRRLGARSCSARSAAQTMEAVRRRRRRTSGKNGALPRSPVVACLESTLRASSSLYRQSSRGLGGDRHAKPSTHPLPSKAGIRLSRFLASARLHRWMAAAFQAVPASRPREPSRPWAQIQAWGFQCAVCSIDRLPNANTTALRQSPDPLEGVVIYATCSCVAERSHS